MRKIISILIFLFISQFSYGQVFTQTFVDRCTGEVKVVTANFATGSATVAFYNKVRVFTYQEYVNGTLQSWLQQTYAWWNALSPCSQAQQQTQNAQQAAQNAQQAAQTAASATSNITPPPTTGTTNTTNTTSGGTTSGSSSSSSGSSSSSEGSSSGGSTETKTEETKTEETKTEETKEESKEETKEESKEEESSDDSEEEGESSEEKEKEKKEEKKQKKSQMMPIQLKADMMAMQSLTLKYNSVLNIGASQSSIFGDVSYSANLMIWDNLKQVGLSLGKTKVFLDDSYSVSWIDSYGLSYMRSYGMNAITGMASRMKPLGKLGTVGIGINYSYMFGVDSYGNKLPNNFSGGYNLLYTNSYKITKRITYSPAIIGTQSPITFTQAYNTNQVKKVEETSFGTVNTDFMGILSNSFTVQLTRRFSFNTGWTLIYSSNDFVPLMSSFMIGAKLPF